MKLISLTIWYDEPVESLRRLIASLAGVVDTAVFVDGAYKAFPHKSHVSDVEQYRAIYQAGLDHGVQAVVFGAQPEPWINQCAKRTYAFALAEQLGIPYTDYCLVIDADEYLVNPDKHRIRRALRATPLPDVGLVSVVTPHDPETYDPTLKGIHNPYLSTGSEIPHDYPRIFRIHRNVIVGPERHWVYVGETEHGKSIALKGSRFAKAQCSPHSVDLTHLIKIRNETWSRSPDRIGAKHAYGVKRIQLGEDM